jgi:hypothetical protein
MGDPSLTGIPTEHERPPGKGNLPTIPDDDELKPMSPEDTTAHLEQATARINQERRAQQQRSPAKPSANILDW